MSEIPKPVNIFLLFDDHDFDVVERLEKHCASLKHQQKIVVWHHRMVLAGQLEEQEIISHLRQADVILLMITVDLLNSERFNTLEKISLDRWQAKKSLVIPVQLKDCSYNGYASAALRRLPDDQRPVVAPGFDLDERCVNVVQEIRRVVETIKAVDVKPDAPVNSNNLPLAAEGVNTILYITNDPENANAALVNQEIDCIKHRLLLGKCSCSYELIPKNVSTVEDLQRVLLEVRPKIVHFSGYSTPEGQLVFRNSQRQNLALTPQALHALFSLFEDRLETVLLNACYSDPQATAIAQSIPYVIGVEGSIGSQAALDFVKGFYQALSFGTTIEKAYRLARNLLQLQSSPYYEKIVMKTPAAFATD